MHGLRKALGVKLAHADATSRQIMFMLGHKDLSYVELYTCEAEQVRMAVMATDKLTRFERQGAGDRNSQSVSEARAARKSEF